MLTDTELRALKNITQAATNLYVSIAQVRRDADAALNLMATGGIPRGGITGTGPIAGQDMLQVAAYTQAVNSACEFASMLQIKPESIQAAYNQGVVNAR